MFEVWAIRPPGFKTSGARWVTSMVRRSCRSLETPPLGQLGGRRPSAAPLIGGGRRRR